MGRLHRILSLPLLLCVACAGSRPDEVGVIQSAYNLPLVFDSGMVVAPVAYPAPVPGAGDAAALMSNQLTTALYVAWEGGQLVLPSEFVERMSYFSEEQLDAFRRFRQRRQQGEPLTKEECRAANEVAQHRYLLVSWVEESETEGLEETGLDYTNADFANDVRRLQFVRVNGVLTGMIVDLWEAELLWEARAPYRTQNVYGGLVANHEELEVARDEGVLELVRLLMTP